REAEPTRRTARDVGHRAVVGGDDREGHIAHAQARRRVHRQVHRTGDLRQLRVNYRYGETATAAVAAVVARGAGHGRYTHGKREAAGRHAGRAGHRTVV